MRIPTELRDAWKAYSDQHGDTAHEQLRTAMRSIMEGATAAPPLVGRAPSPLPLATAFPASSNVDLGKKRRREIQLTPSEDAALQEVAEQKECSVQFLVVALIRAALTKGHLVAGAELKALAESNYQLMAIGRNLNQIAHQINTDPNKHLHRITLDWISHLRERIDANRVATQAVIEASSERWVIG